MESLKILVVVFTFATGDGDIYISDPMPADECYKIESGLPWSEPGEKPEDPATIVMPMCFSADDPIAALLTAANIEP